MVEPWVAPDIKKEKEQRDLKSGKIKEPIFIDDQVNTHFYKRQNLKQNMPPAVEDHLQTTLKNHKSEL